MPTDDFWVTATPEEYRALAAQEGRKRNKYGAIRDQRDGYKFDSRAEARHYDVLKLRLQAGEIARLVVHPKFRIEVNGVHVCDYVSDFAYEENGEMIVADVKSKPTKTATYRIKSRLMLATLGITVKEVMG